MHAFPLITAHTGCMGTIDNTLHSILAGIESGADIIEEDIRVTADGVPVLAHDDKWISVDGREVILSQLNYASLVGVEIQARHGIHERTFNIRRLEEALQLIKDTGIMMNLDLKDDASINAVSELLQRYNMNEQAFLTGCEYRRASLVQQTHPHLRKLLNAEYKHFLTMTYSEAVEMTLKEAVDTSCFGININYQLVQPELLERAEEQQLPIYVWTVEQVRDMERMFSLGVASITTRDTNTLVKLKYAQVYS